VAGAALEALVVVAVSVRAAAATSVAAAPAVTGKANKP